MGISFSDDRWAYEPGTLLTGQHVSNFDPNPSGVIAEYDDVAAWVDDPRDTMYPNFSVDLEKTESGQHNIYGHYAHTWCPVTCAGPVSFGISAGFFSISTGTGVNSWKKPSNTVEV